MDTNQKTFIGVGIIAVLFVGFLLLRPVTEAPTLSDSDDEDMMGGGQETEVMTATSSDAITLGTQDEGLFVEIESLVLSERLWVAVYELNDGVRGNILGAGRFPEGAHSNQTIKLLRATEEGRDYAILFHQNDGDQIFEYDTDDGIYLMDGKEVGAVFSVAGEEVSN